MLIFAMQNKFSMPKRIIISLALFVSICANAQFAHSFLPSIRTPLMLLNGEWGAPPVVQLGGDDVISFSFDEMSHRYHRYTYRIVHCNSDWTPSDLLEIDYLEGFNDVVIDNCESSVNTTQLYTHYEFAIPNEEVTLKVSGNYRVEVYDDELDSEEPVLLFEFSVGSPNVIPNKVDTEAHRADCRLAVEVEVQPLQKERFDVVFDLVQYPLVIM